MLEKEEKADPASNTADRLTHNIGLRLPRKNSSASKVSQVNSNAQV